MKSKKAEEFIEKNIIRAIYPEGDLFSSDAENAVEIAEEELLDRANKAYCKSCYFSVTCENKFNDNCSFLKEFINELNK